MKKQFTPIARLQKNLSVPAAQQLAKRLGLTVKWVNNRLYMGRYVQHNDLNWR